MAHFAELDADNLVLRVIVVADEHEADGVNWCADILGGTWIQTSYNANIRGKFASIGDKYDPVASKFVPQKEFPSWVWDDANECWIPPIPWPTDNVGPYRWDEESVSWKEFDIS